MKQPNETLLKHFKFEGDLVSCEPNYSGHINGTFVLTYKLPCGCSKRYIIQRINTSIFTKPVDLMENIDKVSRYIRSIAVSQGKDPERSTLHIVKTEDGALYHIDEDGDFWRAYFYIEGCIAYDKVERPEHFYNAGVALGVFQKMLDKYPSEELVETIANFHNTPSRFKDFEKAVADNISGRKESVLKEIAFFEERKDFYGIVTDRINAGTIPLRVTHNDTKLNNILMDIQTGEVACLIDMDTVMPGSALYDFGDSIRFGTNTAAEDEQDLDKVHFDINMYEVYVKGYLSEMGKQLLPDEIALLPESGILMTLECGMRFLGDHLNGDIYFGIHRENHNLDRARTQIKLAWEMEQNIEKMREITKSALN